MVLTLRKAALVALLTVACVQMASATDAVSNPLIEGETWADLKGDIIGDEPILDDNTLFRLEAPNRAHDAATVPVVLKQLDPARPILGATVVVDENPAPVAAEFEFSEAMAPLNFELRVRVNLYSNVRAIARTDAGLIMDGRFVKASGGCSAPATRDPEMAAQTMGQMKLRLFGPDPQLSLPKGTRREAQIMIRHPNYSGLQRNQLTQLFIPAHFIDQLDVWQGDEKLFTMTGGISVSENPVFRFEYTDNGSSDLHIRATDTEGNAFEQLLQKTAGL
ncbi:quinoprotein dehydrogenase-associated SoxYZ-like carrier [Phaeobacter sp. B1627]|uniref:quinoprotein dehydrogenase-associated SoxYZ-like carrier n=1 Tax=Phaeobacter sp. B1627 TaxID=2583809 RepID=UPI0011185558|nr:quinoprotein dehydrogenase-associated SoxYZ-like carrier [Phaeobacter sp. B1627]TNJ40593.1 quinoprotein dehydrogenase-associated SoxYZ-like carrier [Phaeobacter sp. B1627]